MKVNSGDIFWGQLPTQSDEEIIIPHPYVVLQADDLNDTVVACALTSNLHRVSLPGNILLEIGEGNLPRHSVIEVAKITSLDKTQLGDYIGTLSEQRIHQIFAGIRFIERAFLARDENGAEDSLLS